MYKVFRAAYRPRQYLAKKEREKIRRDFRRARDRYYEALMRAEEAYGEFEKTEKGFRVGKPGPDDQEVDTDDSSKSDQ